jgi:hypothetical protein
MPRPVASVRLSVFHAEVGQLIAEEVRAPDRRALNDRDHGELSFRRQSELLGIAVLVSGPPPAAN